MLRLIAVLSFFVFASNSVLAADCGIVYDEYDSLMNKHYLLNPSDFVSVKNDRISRNQYNSQQKGEFLFKSGRGNYGVAIVHTNNNTWGKMLYTWKPGKNGAQPSLFIKEYTLYGRVMDGYRPRTRRNITIPSSWTFDLDTGKLGGSGADIWFHNVDGKTMYLQERNGASLTFPMESICD